MKVCWNSQSIVYLKNKHHYRKLRRGKRGGEKKKKEEKKNRNKQNNEFIFFFKRQVNTGTCTGFKRTVSISLKISFPLNLKAMLLK